ncbi:molybdopterin molybdotransferase MoeA [Paracidobacterium acidisoli]|uniref:molybdopterin molybdotransferase MoeA n=1 Tax=Paracidobacterium acidisoli TaxID=2303751 RepID=UPI0026B90C25
MQSGSRSIVLSYAEAVSVVAEEARRVKDGEALRSERVALRDAAGRVLARAIDADRDQPPFPRSTRDGFACRAADLTKPGIRLRVMGLVRAGEMWMGSRLDAGEAAEIMTGAPVPAGADCVVMVEHVIAEGGTIQVMPGREPASGENIVPEGAEARAGAVVVPAGVRMGPAQIAAAAACGVTQPEVFARPRVAILATGDELVEAEEQPQAWQIRNSNSWSLAAQVMTRGGEPVGLHPSAPTPCAPGTPVLPIVPDDPEATRRAIESAMGCELILLTGGVSMGRFDFVEQALLALDAEFLFTGVKIQPGRPVVFGRLPGAKGKQYFFGLPGNPLSTMVTFALFAAPMLAALSGENRHEPAFGMARLAEEIVVKPGLTRFLPARREGSVDGTVVRRMAWQGSGDLASAAAADCFVAVREDAERMQAGEPVTTLLI